jgi:signal peptidase II
LERANGARLHERKLRVHSGSSVVNDALHRPPPSTTRWARGLWISAAVIAADQLTKAAVLATIREGDGWAVTGFFSLVLTFNTGAAFSFLASASGWQRWFFAAIAAMAAIVIVMLLKRGGSAMYSTGLALILGGALGNLYDRLALGKVVDFLLFHYAGWAYPAFNLADSAITIGAVLLVADSFRRQRPGAAAKGLR